MQHPVGTATAIGWPPLADKRRPEVIGAACAPLVAPLLPWLAALAWLATLLWAAALSPARICPVAAGQIRGAGAWGAWALRAGSPGFCAGLAAFLAGFAAILIRHAAFRSG